MCRMSQVSRNRAGLYICLLYKERHAKQGICLLCAGHLPRMNRSCIMHTAATSQGYNQSGKCSTIRKWQHFVAQSFA